MRQFIRHPLDVPIEIRTAQLGTAAMHTQDISLGGLAVHLDAPVEPGSLIEVRIAYVEPAFEARARVAWCRPRRDGAGHEVGVSFLDPEDVFRARMVAQICYIEDYRRSIARDVWKRQSDHASGFSGSTTKRSRPGGAYMTQRTGGSR